MCEKNNTTRTRRPRRLLRRVAAAAAAAAVITAAGSAAAQEPAVRPAVALDPATAIVDAFRTHQTTTFADLPRLQRDVISWRIPSLALLRGTAIGAAGYETFLGPPPPVYYFRANPRIEDHFDAVLDLGASSSMTMSPLSYPRCADPAYGEMRVGRMILTGSPATIADRLKQNCAAAASQAPSFEVASVKINRSGQPGGMGDFQPGGQVRVVNETLRQVIRAAYGFDTNRILGGPAWIDIDRFDIQARAASAVPREELMSMVRTLLADRFKLVARVERRELPIWELIPSTTNGTMGPRLRPASLGACVDRGAIPASAPPGQLPSCGRLSAGPGRMSGRSVSVDLLATQLAPRVGRVVVNRTGLAGLLDIDLEWGLDDAQAAALASLTPLGGTPPVADPSRPGIFTALQEQLGLKLESATGSVEVLVIDSVERPAED